MKLDGFNKYELRKFKHELMMCLGYATAIAIVYATWIAYDVRNIWLVILVIALSYILGLTFYTCWVKKIKKAEKGKCSQKH